MARMARDSTPKRRSARLSNNQSQSTRKTPGSTLYLDAVLERDETPEVGEQALIDNVLSTPSTHSNLRDRLEQMSNITTPKTEPKVAQDQMHPATVHQTTAKAPDSGLKLGFADISTTGGASLASLQNTPSRPRQSLANTNISPSFQFKFSHESNMSDGGRQMMESIREEAARIKEQMRVEKELQEQTDVDADSMFENAAGRRIARPTARAGRFSDVHMAEFKKMDSIANHASAFRAKPGFARPTAQSLKRSNSKADLDEPERPRTAGRDTITRIPPPVTGRLGSTSPFKNIQRPSSNDSDVPAKRFRGEDDDDVSTSRSTTLPRPVPGRLLAPAKASTARVAENITTPIKSSAIPRSNSVKSVRSITRQSGVRPISPSKMSIAQLNKPLPPTPAFEAPTSNVQGLIRSQSRASIKKSEPQPKDTFSSRIPTMASLKSILRSPRKAVPVVEATTPKHISAVPVPVSSHKKVDFTPSVKSRYAVRLAEGSPSPAKLDRSKPAEKWEPAIPYDSSAFVVNYDDRWEDEDDDGDGDLDVDYPTLPTLSPRPISKSGPVDHTIHNFTQQAREHGHRASKEFKSIFTTLHPKPASGAPSASSITSVNMNVERTSPTANAYRVTQSPVKSQPSPSSIRRVRASEPVQPFEDQIHTVPHGLPGKKRRMESNITNDKFGHDEDAKENRRVSHIPDIPGAWNDGADVEQDEGEKRGGKRARVERSSSGANEQESAEATRKSIPVPSIKKPSAAREAAAKHAKDRKVKASTGGATTPGRMLSLSRLNALARPKNRG